MDVSHQRRDSGCNQQTVTAMMESVTPTEQSQKFNVTKPRKDSVNQSLASLLEASTNIVNNAKMKADELQSKSNSVTNSDRPIDHDGTRGGGATQSPSASFAHLTALQARLKTLQEKNASFSLDTKTTTPSIPTFSSRLQSPPRPPPPPPPPPLRTPPRNLMDEWMTASDPLSKKNYFYRLNSNGNGYETTWISPHLRQ
jgi:hypothetical protein